MATAKQLPNGKWRIQISCGKDEYGRYIRPCFTADTKREVERLAAQFSGDLKKYKADRAAGRIPLGEAMESYIEICRMAGKSPSTLAAYQSIYRSTSNLHRMVVTDITMPRMQRIVLDWSKKNSPKTVFNKYSFVCDAIRSTGLKPDFSDVQLPKREHREMVIPQDEDVYRALQTLKTSDEQVYIAVLLASTLGLRRSEICALEWSDVDFDNSTISVNKALVLGDDGVHHVKDTKTQSGTRTLYVEQSVMNELRKRRQLSGRIVKVSPDVITQHYKSLCKRLAIPGRFHDLRHYMASVMAALNVPEKYAMEIMGHSTPAMTRDVYTHVMDKKRSACYDTIDTHTSKLVSGEAMSY